MAAKPRPNKNASGVNKQPTMSRTIHAEPGQPPQAPPPPGSPPPGTANPMTHPAHPAMQSSMGAGPQPGTPPMGPTGKPADQRQVRETIQFKDLPPPSQAQVEQQQGIDPYAPLKMVQQETQGAIQGGPSTGSIPNELAGPFVPPGVESFPDDFAHLTTLMQQGFAPGATNQEHEFAANAHAIANARLLHAFQQGQHGAGQVAPMQQPMAPPPQQGPVPQVGLAPGIPTGQPGMPPPDMQSSMGAPQGMPPGMPPGGPPGAPPAAPGGPAAPPLAPGAPGGVPPELIHAIIQKHLGKGKTR